MIRVVEIDGVEGARYAFLDTVTMRFVDVSGVQAFADLEDLEAAGGDARLVRLLRAHLESRVMSPAAREFIRDYGARLDAVLARTADLPKVSAPVAHAMRWMTAECWRCAYPLTRGERCEDRLACLSRARVLLRQMGRPIPKRAPVSG